MDIIKYVVTRGRPSLVIPSHHLDDCDQNKQPVIVVWRRVAKADVSWFNEPYQCSHRELFSREDFRQDIEARAEAIFQKYALPKSARAITPSFMTLYDLNIDAAYQAAGDLFDMTTAIIGEYDDRNVKS